MLQSSELKRSSEQPLNLGTTEVLDSFYDSLISRGTSLVTVKRCQRYLADLMSYSASNQEQVTAKVVEKWLKFQASNGKKFNSLLTLLYIAHQYFRFCNTDINVTSIIRRMRHYVERNDDLPIFLNEDDLTKIQTVSLDYPKYACLIQLISTLGIKTFEIPNVMLSDFDIQHKTLIIRNQNGCLRLNSLTNECFLLLKQYVKHREDDSPYLLPGIRGKRIDLHEIYFIVQWCAGRADLCRIVTPSILRNTCIAQMIRNGKPIENLTNDLGYHNATQKIKIMFQTLRNQDLLTLN